MKTPENMDGIGAENTLEARLGLIGKDTDILAAMKKGQPFKAAEVVESEGKKIPIKNFLEQNGLQVTAHTTHGSLEGEIYTAENGDNFSVSSHVLQTGDERAVMYDIAFLGIRE